MPEAVMEDLINLTPHTIVIRVGGVDHAIPPSGTVARVSTAEAVVGEIDGVPVVRAVYGEVTGLPEEGTPCIVSAMVRAAVPGRAGVYSPDTGPSAIRDERGQIVAVTRLIAA
jgi:hypothetical protein